jgi:hypothetical protein
MTLFVQVLGMAGEIGVLKLGTVALDGTKIHARALSGLLESRGSSETGLICDSWVSGRV